MINLHFFEGLKMIIEIIGGMIAIWLFLFGGLKKIIAWFVRPDKRLKALEDQAKKFEEELLGEVKKFEDKLHEFKEEHKELKKDIETLETDYKEIFKILLNRK